MITIISLCIGLLIIETVVVGLLSYWVLIKDEDGEHKVFHIILFIILLVGIIFIICASIYGIRDILIRGDIF